MPLGVGSLVWEKWRNDWYMGQVIELDDEASTEQGVACAPTVRRVKIHIHGEPETRDKWYTTPCENVVELVQVQAKETAVGVFPQAGDCVELLVLDEPLASSACLDSEQSLPLLAGTVQRVYPGRDASMVEVEYPREYDAIVPGSKRRVCVGNGYLRVRQKEASQ